MGERLSLRSEITLVPEGADELRKQFISDVDENKYPLTTSCWRCNKDLDLEKRPHSYLIGPYDMYFGRVPLYYCRPCDRVYFPGDVLLRIQELAERELKRLNPPPPPRNPKAVAFYQAYRNS